jgi:aspartyl-tRNA(Asn)/glutamyl-tRNA(Gln) amidotransferase subunit A
MNDVLTAFETARRVRDGAVSAIAVVEQCLESIAAANPSLNAFADVFAAHALAAATRVDAMVAQGANPGRLSAHQLRLVS